MLRQHPPLKAGQYAGNSFCTIVRVPDNRPFGFLSRGTFRGMGKVKREKPRGRLEAVFGGEMATAKIQTVMGSRVGIFSRLLIGFVAYILIFFRIIQFANITLHLFGCQFMDWEWEHPESIKPMFSNLLQTIAVFTCLDMVNNWRLWRN